ncbi:MAG: hypothetical protein EBU90_12225 [Proteobacteria bacterium]|nr:hypothetical protein [Pseudomonadota bacterium]
MKLKVFGIKTIEINGSPAYAINIRINGNSKILNKVINDEFWNTHHTVHMYNSKSKITFKYLTMNINDYAIATKSLLKILFAHKTRNLYQSSFLNSYDKKDIMREVIQEELESFIL